MTQRSKVNYNTGETTDETFTYDAAGNITCTTEDCCDTDKFIFDKNNRLTYYDGTTVTYDADGNMISAYHNGGRESFKFDSTNRLIGTNKNAYTYNAENVRIRNLCGYSDTTYVYNTNAKLSSMLTKTTNGVVTKYVYGRGLIGEETEGSFKTYHFDYRGSTVAITDINGNTTDTFEYDTYGKLTSRTGDGDVIFMYNGRDGVVTDSNGLIYMRARYYSPELHRFINADILAGDIANAVTLNRYAYANANPVSMIDPRGLSAERSITAEENAFLTGVIKKILSASETYSLEELEASVYAGQIKFYCNITTTIGDGDVDVSKIAKGQIELAQSIDTSIGTFQIRLSTETVIEYSCSAQITDDQSISAAISVNVIDEAVSAEYTITTDINDTHSVSTTLGMEMDNDNYTSGQAPATVPTTVSQKESFWDKVGNAVNAFGEGAAYVLEETVILAGKAVSALGPIGVLLAATFVLMSPIP